MSRLPTITRRALTLLALASVSVAAWAAGADLGQAEKQATNWTAIGMFGAGVGMLYTPILVDRLQLTFPSGLAVANILGISVGFTTAGEVIARYQELITLRQAKGKGE